MKASGERATNRTVPGFRVAEGALALTVKVTIPTLSLPM